MNSQTFQKAFKMNEKDFTRERKLTFNVTLLFIMNRLTKSIAIEIENFVNLLKNECNFSSFKRFSKSAFVQARKKIKPEVFEELNSMLIEEFYSDNEAGVLRWYGFRLLAVDGSIIALPNSKELRKVYGETKNQNDPGNVQARVSVLYDVLNKYVLDSKLSPYEIGERRLALSHLNKSSTKDLVIYDRGYPSYDFIHEHLKLNVNFLIRAKSSFSNLTKEFISSKKKSLLVEIYPGKNTSLANKQYTKHTPIKVRLIRVDLPSGQVELLITSLIDTNKYKTSIFKKLYFERWKVETFYDELKNKLKVEHFSGYSISSIQQDFNSAIFVSNIQTLIVSELVEEIYEKTKGRQHQYKVNTSLSYGFLKDKVISLFFSDQNMDRIIEKLKELFIQHLVPIRENRKFPRDHKKYRNKVRPKVTKNQKDAW